MTRWHFRIREHSFGAVDASSIQRQALTGKSDSQLAAAILPADGGEIPLGELFDVTIDPVGEDELVFEGDLRNVHGIGALHDAGCLRIEGPAGDFVGASMRGGTIIVEGNPGDFIGAPLGARKVGMTGGEILVRGDAGHYVGHRMRRGTVLVRGSVRTLLAASMIAGTVIVGESVGSDYCVGMKRGTVLLPGFDGEIEPVSRFSPPNRYAAGFLNLVRSKEHRAAIAPLVGTPTRRFRADLDVGGLGEILMPE